MLLRRDGSIDFRVLMTRVAMYSAVVGLAVLLGALVAFAGP